MRTQFVACLAAVVLLIGCGGNLPPIEIVIEPKAPTNSTPSKPVEPPKPPVETPDPEPEPEPLAPLVNLNIVVHDAAGVGIAGASCAVNGDARTADGGGFINFAVRGPVVAACSAKGYVSRAADLPPGDHRFPLVAVEQPKPIEPKEPIGPPALPPTKGGVYPQCGVGENTGRISQACVDAVAAASSFTQTCRVTGQAEACHYLTREIALALKTAQQDERWGLIKKTKGGDNVEGYGVDVVAYLPSPLPLNVDTWRWAGVDVIGGLGAPNARVIGGKFNEVISCDDWVQGMPWCNRTSDIWVPVPVR